MSSDRFLIVLCGLLLTLAAFSLDIILPAFALMQRDLGVPIAEVQMTVPVFFVAMGAGQLLLGPVSDKTGRRSIIALGLVLFIAGSVVAMVSPGIVGVLGGRVLQGLGAGGIQVVARAVIRDRYEGQALARNMSFAMTIFAFGPMVAPLLGGLVVMNDVWRPVFGVTCGFGIILLLMSWRAPETLAPENRRRITASHLLDASRAVFSNRQSRHFVIVSGLAIAAILNFVGNVPVIFENQFGITRMQFSVLFAVAGSGIIVGQHINRMLITRVGTEKAALTGTIGCSASFLTIAALSFFGLLTATWLTLLLFTFNIFYLTIFSNATALCIDPHGKIAGLAAAVTGFCSALIGSTVAAIWTWIADGQTLTWALLTLLQALACFALLLYWIKRPAADATTQP